MTESITAILYVLKDLTAILGILSVMRFIFLEKVSLKLPQRITLVFFVLLNAFLGVFVFSRYTADYDSLMDFISDIIYVVTVMVATGKNSPLRKILTVFIFIYSCDMVWALIAHYLSLNLIIEYAIHILIFLFVIALVVLYTKKVNENILPMIFSSVSGWVYFVLLLFELTCYYREYGISADWYNALYVASSVGIVACVLYVFYKVFTLSYEQSKALEQIKIQTDYFESLKNNDDEIRRFRHDYKNHMMVVSSLLASGKTKDAQKYLDSVNEQVGGSMYSIKTGNYITDAVINSKITGDNDNKIKIKFYGFIPPEGIESRDLCTVFSNLIDNAIEAVNKTDAEKNIEIEANVKNGYFILSISNPSDAVKTDKDGRIQTSKADKKNHGIGLRNVERTVERYKGAVISEYCNGIFTTDLRMKLR